MLSIGGYILAVLYFMFINHSLVSSFKLNAKSFQRKVINLNRLNMSSGADIKRFALEYAYVEDILEKRGPHRARHLELLENLLKDGKLLGAGPYSPPTGALFLFKDTSSASAEQFVKDDPYVSAGLVTSYNIKEWTKVIGDSHI